MPFRKALPRNGRVPILLSIPHCGTSFPDELRNDFKPHLCAHPDDTDWFVDRLYDFAPGLGITVISAVWSRWVIDLNRHPESKPLYGDGRIITDLCPVTTFLGESLYQDERKVVADAEVARRRELYFEPYHQRLRQLMDEIKSEFGRVLLWDCHSIRQLVPTIRPEKFPDLILGSADEKSAAAELIEATIKCLRKSDYKVSHNDPFKGGYITRHYGQPERGMHTLQLEMTKIQYMDDAETRYHPQRAKRMAELLGTTFSRLSEILLKDS